MADGNKLIENLNNFVQAVKLPNKPITRQTFLVGSGAVAIGTLATGCSNVDTLSQQVAAGINNPELQAETPDWIKPREIRVEIDRIDNGYTSCGSGIVLVDEPNYALVLVTDHQVFHGFLINDINIFNENNNPTSINQNDYCIMTDPNREKNNNPLVVIKIDKKNHNHNINKDTLDMVNIFTGTLSDKQTLLCVSYPADEKGNQHKEFTKIQYAGMDPKYIDDKEHTYPPVIVAQGIGKGALAEGSSGAGVFTEDGQLVGIVLGGKDAENKMYIMPVQEWLNNVLNNPEALTPETVQLLCLAKPHEYNNQLVRKKII
jgi:hypothetical protein